MCDRGYTDYDWHKSLTVQGIGYVTRQKGNAVYQVITRNKVDKCTGVRSDSVIRYTARQSKKKYLPDVRQVIYDDEKTGQRYTFITNQFELPAQTIADIYKQRWQVELFFKWIKQNLKIKSFLGTCKNAVMTQIWIAMCMSLLLAFIKFSNKIAASLQQMIRVIGLNLFAKRDLLGLIRGDPPPQFDDNIQGLLC